MNPYSGMLRLMAESQARAAGYANGGVGGAGWTLGEVSGGPPALRVRVGEAELAGGLLYMLAEPAEGGGGAGGWASPGFKAGDQVALLPDAGGERFLVLGKAVRADG